MKFCRTAAVFIILTLLCSATAFARLQPGEPAPDFNASTLEGKQVKLSDLKGQALLVEIGTTWCPSCKELAHQIDSIRDFLKEKKVNYTAVFLSDPVDSIREHLKEEKLSLPDRLLIDNGEARRAYNIFSIPRLLLIDPDFTILFDETVLSADEIKRRINAELE